MGAGGFVMLHLTTKHNLGGGVLGGGIGTKDLAFPYPGGARALEAPSPWSLGP